MDSANDLAQFRLNTDAANDLAQFKPNTDAYLKKHPQVDNQDITSSNIRRNIENIVIKPPTLPDHLRRKLENISITPQIVSQTDFEDDSYKHTRSIKLEHIDDSTIVKYGREMMSSLISGVSQRSIGKIFLLAYQLRASGTGLNLTPKKDELAGINDCDLSCLEDRIIGNGGKGRGEPFDWGSEQSKAQAYAYIAASMMRMFARPPEIYSKSWAHILNGYAKFYVDEIPVTRIIPDPTIIKKIYHCFALDEILRGTLFRFLYNINRDRSEIRLKRFLFDDYLSHTGMHIFPITAKLCAALDCKPHQLLSALYAPIFDPQISELVQAIKLFMNEDDKHVRQMWRYGRLFCPEFMSNLQTKSCRKLVYIMACMLKYKKPESEANILQIKQLEEVCVEDQERCRLGAVKLVEAVQMMKKDED